MVGLMADCWAERMVVTRAGWTAAQMAVKMAWQRAGQKAVSLVDSTVGLMADCWAERMVATRAAQTAV